MANNTYKEEGSDKRKLTYSVGIAVAALALAVVVVTGFVTLDQILEFGQLWIYLIGVITAVILGIQSAIARKNVEPPAPPAPRHASDPDLGGKPENQV